MNDNDFQPSQGAADTECLRLVEKNCCDSIESDTFPLPDGITNNNWLELARDGDSHQATEDVDSCSQKFTVDIGGNKTELSLQTAFLEFRRKKQVRVYVFYISL
jgi:hypothetical protein